MRDRAKDRPTATGFSLGARTVVRFQGIGSRARLFGMVETACGVEMAGKVRVLEGLEGGEGRYGEGGFEEVFVGGDCSESSHV